MPKKNRNMPVQGATAQNVTNAIVVAQALQKQATPLFNKVTKLAIDTQEEYSQAAALLADLKELGKQAKAEQDKFLKPINELLKVTKTHFKPFFDRLTQIEELKKGEMIAFLNKQEAEAKKLEKKFEKGDIKKVATFMRKQEELEVTSEDAVVRNIKRLHITNEKKIPREYLMPNEAKIMAALKDGEEVPGCEIVLEKSIAI